MKPLSLLGSIILFGHTFYHLGGRYLYNNSIGKRCGRTIMDLSNNAVPFIWILHQVWLAQQTR
jgi:hypothetical protein